MKNAVINSLITSDTAVTITCECFESIETRSSISARLGYATISTVAACIARRAGKSVAIDSVQAGSSVQARIGYTFKYCNWVLYNPEDMYMCKNLLIIVVQFLSVKPISQMQI